MVMMFTEAHVQRSVWASMEIVDIFLNYKKHVRQDMINRYSAMLPYMQEDSRIAISEQIDSLHPFANKGTQSKRRSIHNTMEKAAEQWERDHPETIVGRNG